MCIMVAMGEIAVGMPSAGAMSVWVEKYLGKFCGLLSGLTFSIGWVILGGSISIALGRFTCYWFPSMNLEFGTVFWAAVFFSIFVIMNILGTAIAGKGQLILVAILIGIMVLFGVIGIIQGVNTENYSPFMPYGFKGFASVIPIATYAFMGAACLCTAGDECKKTTDLGKGLVWASLTFIIVYCLALFVVLGTIDWKTASMDVSPFTQAAQIIFGPVGASILNLAAWLSAATCLIMGTVYTPSRVFYAMAHAGYLPRALGRINRRTKTPIVAIVVIWVVGLIGIAAAYWAGSTNFYITLSNQAVIAWTISWGLAVIAGIKYRKEIGGANIKEVVGWKQPLFPLVPVIALAGCVYVLYLSFYDIYQFIGFAIWMAAYIVYYLCIKAKVKKGLIDESLKF